MVLNSKCNTCKEPTKFVVGFYDGPRSKGCVYDCKNKECGVYQIRRFSESKEVQDRIKIQNLNSQNGMYAGYIAALRRDAKISMMKMSRIAGVVLQTTVHTNTREKSSIRMFTGGVWTI